MDRIELAQVKVGGVICKGRNKHTDRRLHYFLRTSCTMEMLSILEVKTQDIRHVVLIVVNKPT